MPFYEYRCEKCGHELEKLQKMSDPKLVDCPQCKEPALRKLISAVGFRLKGSGWYETDFKQSGTKRNLAEGSDKPSDSGDDKKAGKSDAVATPKKDASPGTKTNKTQATTTPKN